MPLRASGGVPLAFLWRASGACLWRASGVPLACLWQALGVAWRVRLLPLALSISRQSLADAPESFACDANGCAHAGSIGSDKFVESVCAADWDDQVGWTSHEDLELIQRCRELRLCLSTKSQIKVVCTFM